MPVSIPTTRLFSGRDGVSIGACQVDIGYGIPSIPQDGFVDGNYGVGWDSSSFDFLHGGRWELPVVADMTVHDFLSWNLYTRFYGYAASLESHENGGMVLVLIDSLGNYKAWNIYGSDIIGYTPGGANLEGWFNSYQSGSSIVEFMVEVASAPDYAGGSIDLTDVVAIEIHVRPNSTTGPRGWELYLQYVQLIDTPTATGEFNYDDVYDEYTSMDRYESSASDWRLWSGQIVNPAKLSSGYQSAYFPKCGLNIGDGVTQTTAEISNTSVGLWNLFEDDDDNTRSVGRVVIVNSPRVERFVQSPTDHIVIDNYSLASSGMVGFVCEGSTAGQLIMTNSLIARSELTQLGHGSYTDTQFVDCKSPVEVTADTALSGCAFRDGDYGIKLLAGPGDHSALETRFGGIAVHDIELGSGGAGAYDLSGVTLRAGDTLKIHNDSLNDISVILPAGMSYSTSSDGGAITVISPPTTYTLKMPNIQQYSRVQIYNTSSNTEILNELVGPAGVDYTMISGADYSPGDIGRVRVTYQSSAVAFEPVEIEFTFSEATTINALPTKQSAAASYNAFGVDGSTAPEFAWDSGSVEVDINDIDNETSVQRFAAWWHYFITTPVGIQEAFGAVAWESLNSVRIVSAIVDLHIDNLKNTPLRLTGGRMYRDDGQSIIAATSNSIHVDYAPVYTLETGVSGLTASESAKLDAIGSVPAAVWTHVDRQLTDDPFQGLPVDDLDTIVTSVWSAAARTLTASDNSGAELTAAERQAIIDGVWNAASRSLTTAAGVTGQNISDIVDAVWSAAARTLTASDNSGAELTAAERQAIIDGVWGAASRSLTTAAGVTEQNINDIAQRVWDHEL